MDVRWLGSKDRTGKLRSCLLTWGFPGQSTERVTRIELAFSAWEPEEAGFADLGVPPKALVRGFNGYRPVPSRDPESRFVRSRQGHASHGRSSQPLR